jgi:Methyltransferase domain
MSSGPTGEPLENGSGGVQSESPEDPAVSSKYVEPEYVTLIGRIQRHVVPRTYLEVGVASGRTLALVAPGTVAVGVDPEPHIKFALGAESKVFEKTSDAFFEEEDVRSLMGGRDIDLAFIDGMHRFEFALRDFINIERLASKTTAVLIHDCLPIDEVSARRERETRFWTGDVWKLIVCLKENRPDISVTVVDAAPSGLGVIRNLDPGSTVLSERLEELVDRYMDLPYSSLEEQGIRNTLNVIPNDWAAITEMLPNIRPYPVAAQTGKSQPVWRRIVSRATAARQ